MEWPELVKNILAILCPVLVTIIVILGNVKAKWAQTVVSVAKTIQRYCNLYPVSEAEMHPLKEMIQSDTKNKPEGKKLDKALTTLGVLGKNKKENEK